jgi:hypothetical protein
VQSAASADMQQALILGPCQCFALVLERLRVPRLAIEAEDDRDLLCVRHQLPSTTWSPRVASARSCAVSSQDRERTLRMRTVERIVGASAAGERGPAPLARSAVSPAERAAAILAARRSASYSEANMSERFARPTLRDPWACVHHYSPHLTALWTADEQEIGGA